MIKTAPLPYDFLSRPHTAHRLPFTQCPGDIATLPQTCPARVRPSDAAGAPHRRNTDGGYVQEGAKGAGRRRPMEAFTDEFLAGVFTVRTFVVELLAMLHRMALHLLDFCQVLCGLCLEKWAGLKGLISVFHAVARPFQMAGLPAALVDPCFSLLPHQSTFFSPIP